MIEIGHHSYLLIDGDCGICTHSGKIARRIDKRGHFIITSYQSFPEAELKKFNLSYAKCAREIQLITPRGRVYGGAFGLNYFLFHCLPWRLAVLSLYALLPLLLIEIIGYAVVAKNRHHISRRLGLQACKIGKPHSGEPH